MIPDLDIYIQYVYNCVKKHSGIASTAGVQHDQKMPLSDPE